MHLYERQEPIGNIENSKNLAKRETFNFHSETQNNFLSYLNW